MKRKTRRSTFEYIFFRCQDNHNHSWFMHDFVWSSLARIPPWHAMLSSSHFGPVWAAYNAHRARWGALINQQWLSYAWFNFTCNHAPPPPGTPPGICNLFSLGDLFPSPRHTDRDHPHPRALDRPHIRVLLHLFLSVQKHNDTFLQLLWTFPWVYWEKDNRRHNVVKT